MKKLILGIIIISIALLATGCCDSVEKAKDIAQTAKETSQTISRFSEDMAKLRDEDGGFKLTPARLDRFFTNYPIFVEIVSAHDERIDEIDEDFERAMVGMETLVKLDKDLRDAGINNPAEFYLTMGKVSAIFFYISSQEYLSEAQGQMAEAIEAMKEQLDSPDIPEEQKAMMREAIAEMEASAEETEDTELPDDITQNEIELVRRNFKRIAETMGIEIDEDEPPAGDIS
ncbi:MAG TPA: hypothetical protein ENN07_06430 [candidate division Zixibacteria bacterium]|nr:hypothetical protein [candidate division Zixibacteria bacterium]